MGSGCTRPSDKYAAAFPEGHRVHPRRRLSDPGVIEYPDYWHNRGNGDFQSCVECDVTDAEAMSLQKMLDQTVSENVTSLSENVTSGSSTASGQRFFKIHRLIRVEDAKMWKQYEGSIKCISMAREEDIVDSHGLMDLRTPSGTLQQNPWTTQAMDLNIRRRIRLDANETYLWHGTGREAAETISRQGVHSSKAGSANGAVLGRGTYLAESSSLADKYSRPGDDGLYALLLVRAALGKVYVAKQYSKWRGKRLVRMVSTTKLVRRGDWDSVLGDRNKAFSNNIREYVVANDTQVYPEYLILYSRESQPVTVKEKAGKTLMSKGNRPESDQVTTFTKPKSLNEDISTATESVESENSFVMAAVPAE